MAHKQPSRFENPFVEDNVVLEHDSEDLVQTNPKSINNDERERSKKVRNGGLRLEKRAAKRVSGLPKKSGQGGKYTWNGPVDGASLDFPPMALDEKDPNYVDEDDVVEVPKPDHLSPLPQKVSAVDG